MVGKDLVRVSIITHLSFLNNLPGVRVSSLPTIVMSSYAIIVKFDIEKFDGRMNFRI